MPPPGNETPRRKNGFVRPYTGAQLSTWIALPVLIAEFIVVVTPVLPLEAAIPCTVVLGITAALAAYYAFMAQLIDPMDEYLAKHLAQQENGQEPEDNGFGGCLGGVGDEVEPMKHCWICETQVAENAMHCKFCNKCVGNFDHHCMCMYKRYRTVSEEAWAFEIKLFFVSHKLLLFHRAEHVYRKEKLPIFFINHGVYRCHAGGPLLGSNSTNN